MVPAERAAGCSDGSPRKAKRTCQHGLLLQLVGKADGVREARGG